MDILTIEATNLTRIFGENKAVKDVSFNLKKGEVLGFLGPNGAGKSTTMRMLTGNLAPSDGIVKICDINIVSDPKKAKTLLGYLPENRPLYKEFTVDEFLTIAARFHKVPSSKIIKAVEVAKDRCGLLDMSKRLIENLSNGYQQRVGIAQAIIHNPEVVILDEADFMTAQAHIHLYNLIKSSPSNVTFIIICNFLFCMDEQLRNCLVRLKFSAPPKKTITAYARRIMKSENVENTIPIEKIVDAYYPDIRSIINVCQRQCKMPVSPPFIGQCMLSRQAAQLGTSKLNVAKVTIEQMLRDTKDSAAALSLANKYCIFATLSATDRRLACDYFLTSIVPSI